MTALKTGFSLKGADALFVSPAKFDQIKIQKQNDIKALTN